MSDRSSDEEQVSFVGIPTFIHAPFVRSFVELQQEGADVAIVGAPAEMVINRPGARFGPRAIRQAGYVESPNDYVYHMELEVYPTRVLKIVDYGDAACTPLSIELSHKAIKSKVSEVLKAGAKPLVLGGDHSITLPVGTAIAERYGFGEVGMIHFDAHADTWDSIYGATVSHGSPMRRLIESGAIPGKNFVQVGLRGYSHDEELLDWMRDQGMQSHRMSDIEQRGFDVVLNDAIAQALDGPENIYLSVDIDVLDPAFAPGTGTPEPGGLTSQQLLRAIRRIACSVNLVGMDIVEVSPPYDGPAGLAAEAAHRVALEAISSLAWRKKNKN